MTSPERLDLPPLDQIRLAEAEVIRRLAASRLASEEAIAEAQARAAAIQREAVASGREEGKARYREAVSAAEAEADVILAESRRRAEELRNAGMRRQSVAVDLILDAVLGGREEPAEQ